MQTVDETTGRRARKPRDGAEADGYKVICIRLRAAEFEQFEMETKAAGLTSSMAMRIAVRRVGGFLEVDPALREDLQHTLDVIGTLSHAVRDLHAACIAGASVSTGQLDHQRAMFGGAFAELDGMLRSILNVSRRRADGMALLMDTAPQ